MVVSIEVLKILRSGSEIIDLIKCKILIGIPWAWAFINIKFRY